MAQDINALLQEAQDLGISPELVDRVRREQWQQDMPELSDDDKAGELLDMFKEAQDLGIDPELIERAKEEELGEYRQKLGQEMVQAETQQKQADVMLEASQDSAVENAYEGLGEMAAAGNRLVFETADFVLSPAIAITQAAYDIAGYDKKAPTVTDTMAQLGIGEGGYVEEPYVQQAVETVGQLMAAGPAAVPVQRSAAQAGSIIQDFLGLGTSTGTSFEASLMLAGQSVDQAAQNIAMKRAGEQFRMRAGKAVGDAAAALAEAEATMTGKALKHLNETGEELTGLAYGKALEDTSLELGIPMSRIRAGEAARGRVINFEGKKAKDLIQKEEYVDEITANALQTGFKGFFANKYEHFVQPETTMARNRVGPAFAGRMQRMSTRVAQDSDRYTSLFTSKPAIAFSRALDSDSRGELRAAILNMSSVKTSKKFRAESAERARMIARALGGEDAVVGMKAIQNELRRAQALSKQKVNNLIETDPNYWPSSTKAKYPKLSDPTKPQLTQAREESLLEQQRRKVTGAQARTIYENPVVVADDWLRRQSSMYHMYDSYGLENYGAKVLREAAKKGKPVTDKMRQKAIDKFQKGEEPFLALENRLRMEGADYGTADRGRGIMKSLVVKGSQGPSAAIANFRRAAYMGTIANPYSAVLNVGDVFNSMVNFGVKNTAKGVINYFTKAGLVMSVDDIGLAHQTTGEFMRDGVGKAQQRFNKMSDKSFELSGFRSVDRFGKDVAMDAALANNREAAVTDFKRWSKGWEGVFTPKEIRQLQGDLAAQRKSQLVKELAAAELSRMQPTDIASLPKWAIDHPNARVLYMLRTFGLKQIQQMENLIFNQYRQGNKAQAIKNGLAFMAIAGGGNAAVNTARQKLKDPTGTIEEGTFGEKYADWLLGATTANMLSYYGIERATGGDPSALISGMLPPIGIAVSPIVDIAQASQAEGVDIKEAVKDSEMFGWVPYGRLIQDWLKD